MTDKTVAQKAHIKPGTTIAVLNPVPGIVESLGLPDDVTFVGPTVAQLVFLFVNTHAELEAQMPPAVAELAPGAAIWIFFRKGAKALGLDMNRDSVWAIAERLDMRPLGIVGIDDDWSAFRLRPAR
jgi:hypothetical protein